MEADTVTKDFIADAAVFADVFNYYIYEGQQVIRPEQLARRDSVEIAPALMSDDEIRKFQINLREVLLFIKYAKDKERLREVLESNEQRFREVERRAADVIRVITNSDLKYDEKELRVDACQAIKEMREESERIGEERGEKIGILKKAKEDARNFYRLGVKVEIIAEGVNCDLKTVQTWLGLPTG